MAKKNYNQRVKRLTKVTRPRASYRAVSRPAQHSGRK